MPNTRQEEDRHGVRDKFVKSANEGKILANKCTNCGHYMLETVYFCEKCGKNTFDTEEVDDSVDKAIAPLQDAIDQMAKQLSELSQMFQDLVSEADEVVEEEVVEEEAVDEPVEATKVVVQLDDEQLKSIVDAVVEKLSIVRAERKAAVNKQPEQPEVEQLDVKSVGMVELSRLIAQSAAHRR